MTDQISRRQFMRLVGLTGAGMILSSCSPAAAPQVSTMPAAGNTPASGAATRPTIRMLGTAPQGVVELPQPFGFRTGPAFERVSFLFDALVWRDSTPDPIPWLAEKWEHSEDDTQWTFTLRPNVKFHDGQPLTTEDVVFSYQYISAHATNWFSSVSQVLKDVKAADDHTIQITLNAPFAPFLSSIAANVPIIPKHIWENVDDPQKFTDQSAYLGSGPYRLQEFSTTESSFLYVANDEFFLGKPYVGRLEYIPVGDELLALKAGDLDIASPSPIEGLSDEALVPFKSDPKYAILEAPGEGTTALHFNLTHDEPYSNVLFRRAVIYAIDRDELVTRILTGNGAPGTPGYLAPSNPYANPDVEQYAYDPEQAKALLDQAGYPESDGQRQLPDGSPLVVPLLFASTVGRTAELIRDQLGRIGIQVEMKPVDPGTANQLQGEGNYDASLVTYGGLGSDPDFMRRAFSSPEQAKFWWKAWGYNNPEFNDLAQQQLRALDSAHRTELVHQMESIIAQDVPVMPLYYPTRFLIYVPAVFDAWYYTPLWNPLPHNKHAFVTGQKTGLEIRGQ